MGFEVQRVVVPAKVLRADVVVLFTLNRADNARRALELAIADLSTERIQHHVVECNIWDPPTVVNEVGSIVTASPHHEYFFNVSTGAKTACIGGTIAGMFWRVQPYYQAVDYGSKPIAGKEDYPVKGPPVFVPTFETPMLDRGTVGTLEFIVNQKAPTSKRELMNHLKESSTDSSTHETSGYRPGTACADGCNPPEAGLLGLPTDRRARETNVDAGDGEGSRRREDVSSHALPAARADCTEDLAGRSRPRQKHAGGLPLATAEN